MHETFPVPPVLSSSGRPLPDRGEYATYAESYLQWVHGDDAVQVLVDSGTRVLDLYASLDEPAIAGRAYAPGKWTLKEILGHLADDERIFAYRALAIARGEGAELPGFEQDDYVATSGFEARPLADLIAEYRSVRQASLTLFASLTAEAWQRRGTVSGYSASPRGLAFHVAGHELHHLDRIRRSYLPLLG